MATYSDDKGFYIMDFIKSIYGGTDEQDTSLDRVKKGIIATLFHG